MSYRIIEGDCLDVLRTLEAGSVQTCITSPPYWGLRDYGSEGQLGLEPTPEKYVANLVAVFREVRRVLRDDGTLWLNLGDSYFGSGRGPSNVDMAYGFHQKQTANGGFPNRGVYSHDSIKSKDLVGIPWMVAFALRADGWYLRSDIIWAKPNPMPESVTDRPTKAHEYLFLLSKSPRYFYDADAIREEAIHAGETVTLGPKSLSVGQATGMNREPSGNGRAESVVVAAGRNKRSVWTVTTQPFPGAHFATFPPKLIEPCVLAGTPPKCCGECGAPWERVVEREPNPTKDSTGPNLRPIGPNGETDARYRSHGDSLASPLPQTLGWEPTCEHDDDSGRSLVLDPFNGAGTTGLVATRHDRDYIGIELNSRYAEMARQRIADDAPLLNALAEPESGPEPAPGVQASFLDVQTPIQDWTELRSQETPNG